MTVIGWINVQMQITSTINLWPISGHCLPAVDSHIAIAAAINTIFAENTKGEKRILLTYCTVQSPS